MVVGISKKKVSGQIKNEINRAPDFFFAVLLDEKRQRQAVSK
jgi:hypothetical protein